jgi:uncharacterized membrane-anchored protein
MKQFTFILFGMMCIAQWFVPGQMIYNSEIIMSEGLVFKFKTAPIDPSDPFRGKYITLQFEADFMKFADSTDFVAGQEIFVTFKTDSAGFAEPDEIFQTKPEKGSYLRTTVDYVINYKDDHRIEFDLPFDRFYLEESKALRAEQLYREAQRDSAQVAYALVSIGPGQAVIKDVIINDKPIVNLINELGESDEP